MHHYQFPEVETQINKASIDLNRTKFDFYEYLTQIFFIKFLKYSSPMKHACVDIHKIIFLWFYYDNFDAQRLMAYSLENVSYGLLKLVLVSRSKDNSISWVHVWCLLFKLILCHSFNFNCRLKHNLNTRQKDLKKIKTLIKTSYISPKVCCMFFQAFCSIGFGTSIFSSCLAFCFLVF